MGNVFPPQFGVPLTADELNSNIPTSVLYGVTPGNEFIPVKIDSVGAVAISGTISVGTVTIEGVDPVDDTTHPLALVNFGPDGYALRTAIFDGGNQLTVNPDGSINTNVSLTLSNVGILNASNVRINPSTEETLVSVNAGLETLNSLVPSVYDYIALSYTGNNLTQAVYKLGGVGGTVVSTLNLAYTGNNLTSVTKV